FGALDVETAIRGEGGAVSAHARRGHAIEEIHPAAHALDEIFRKTDSHQVSRAIDGQGVSDDVEDAILLWLCFADRQPSHTEPAPIVHLRDGGRRLATQRLV